MESTTVEPEPKRSGRLSRRGALLATTLGLATGGFAGGYLVSQAATSTPSPSPASTGTSSGSSSTSTGSGSAGTGTGSGATAPSGTFTPNEDPTHEAGESAAREAQENAGQRPTVP